MKTLISQILGLVLLMTAFAVAQPITAHDGNGNTLDVLTFGSQFYTEGQIAPVEGATLIGVTVTYHVSYFDSNGNEIG